jgi:hypothetical protein
MVGDPVHTASPSALANRLVCDSYIGSSGDHLRIFDSIVVALRSERSKMMCDKLYYWKLVSFKSNETVRSI